VGHSDRNQREPNFAAALVGLRNGAPALPQPVRHRVGQLMVATDGVSSSEGVVVALEEGAAALDFAFALRGARSPLVTGAAVTAEDGPWKRRLRSGDSGRIRWGEGSATTR